MTIRIKRGNHSKDVSQMVEKISGVDFGMCYQCKKCASGCPVADLSESPAFEVIRRLQLGASIEMLENDLIWLCTSCETCYARCPMGIDIAGIMDALRVLSAEAGVKSDGQIPLFNKAFLKTVQIFGRAYDMGLLSAYRLGTMAALKDKWRDKAKNLSLFQDISQDMDKIPDMYKKRKIALLPSFKGDRATVKRIFRVTRQFGKKR